MVTPKLRAAVLAMPDTKEKLLSVLKAEGITGTLHADCGDCIVARYLNQVTGEGCEVGLKSLSDDYCAWSIPWERWNDEISLNEAACQIAAEFDAGVLDPIFYQA